MQAQLKRITKTWPSRSTLATETTGANYLLISVAETYWLWQDSSARGYHIRDKIISFSTSSPSFGQRGRESHN